MFDHPSYDHHEGVHFFEDERSGLKAIIAVHSTARGPAAGGCRMWDYDTGEDALRDALRLSQGMSFKNAMADLPLGGGKAVIWGNSRTGKSKELFEAFGRAIESLNGSYYTAEDVGIDTDDIAIVSTQTKYVAGLDTGAAASGDPSPTTALGVYRGIKACAERAFGTGDLSGRVIAVQGVGSVGGYLCDHLANEGAKLFIADIDKVELEAVRSRTGAEIIAPESIYDTDAEIFSPNALGAIINPQTLPRLKAKVIAGGANNQLASPEMGFAVQERGILYAPDYVINGGGIINVAAEISGEYSRDWVMTKLDTLVDTLGHVLDEALSANEPTHLVADRMARARIASSRPA
ncbi:Leu/Phe/Val dehydrogenase [Henriciella pelagia]|jgi:leucine dehydrogenase|uniref:Amino acid dehydrogenase n=1 Tax=Henriciella pelagia TaxID=1977912 RepID=A0ABQ1J4S0_9PROT|nr:Glu/Leu/Phe/Val dehydrogenase dimerization domain-containing protein [Henriciella pelagia]GGB58752.1 amino acid dehydrogenase [Henriciella pelagia]